MAIQVIEHTEKRVKLIWFRILKHMLAEHMSQQNEDDSRRLISNHIIDHIWSILKHMTVEHSSVVSRRSWW